MNRLVGLGVAVDQFFNVLLGGWPDETLSARAWRKRDDSPAWGRVYRAINAVFFWQADHCLDSWVAETERRQLPRDYRR